MLELIARGLSNREIGTALFVEESTRRTHVKRIQMKLQLRDRVQIVIFAYETGVNRPAAAANPRASGLKPYQSSGYPACVALNRLRGRMPLFAFILLAVVCLALFGFACACLDENPAQVLERAVASAGDMPAVIEVWSYAAVAMVLGALSIWTLAIVGSRERASPARLQRFLF